MTVGSLFAGIGGLDLGFERAGFDVRWQIEKNEYCRRVLSKHWPNVRRYGDITEVNAAELEPVECIVGGFPCQQISSAGKGTGLDGEQSGLWWEYWRFIRDVRPRYAVVENVADLIYRGLDAVLGSLAKIGYDAEWQSLPAAAFGLPQRRWRLFLVAYPHGGGLKSRPQRNSKGQIFERWDYTDGLALAERRARHGRSWVRRATDGAPHRVDRLRSTGNAVVPQVAEYVARCVLRHANANTP